MLQRLLLATDSHDPSGVGVHMLALAQGLRDGQGLHGEFDIVIAAPADASGDLLSHATGLGFRVEAIDEGRSAIFEGRFFDIAHIHAGIGWEGHQLAELAKRAGIGTVVRTEHLPYVLTDPAQQEAYRHGLGHVTGLICVSAAAAASFVAAGVPERLISIVRNGVVAGSQCRSRSAVRDEIGVGEADFLAVTVARLTDQKNHFALVAALPQILASYSGFRLALVGTGPLETRLRDAVVPFGDAVLFLGQRDDVPDLLAAADLFVLPSLFEGLPLSLIEAMAAGLPVVASDVGGIDEVVAHGVTGFLASPEKIEESMLIILRDTVAAARMGQAGRERFQTDFSHFRMSRQTSDVYARLARAADSQIGKMA